MQPWNLSPVVDPREPMVPYMRRLLVVDRGQREHQSSFVERPLDGRAMHDPVA